MPDFRRIQPPFAKTSLVTPLNNLKVLNSKIVLMLMSEISLLNCQTFIKKKSNKWIHQKSLTLFSSYFLCDPECQVSSYLLGLLGTQILVAPSTAESLIP